MKKVKTHRQDESYTLRVNGSCSLNCNLHLLAVAVRGAELRAHHISFKLRKSQTLFKHN